MLQERENPTLTEWDRFAHREYIRLSMEEDVEDASNGSAEVWDESLEAPFWIWLGKFLMPLTWSNIYLLLSVTGEGKCHGNGNGKISENFDSFFIFFCIVVIL